MSLILRHTCSVLLVLLSFSLAIPVLASPLLELRGNPAPGALMIGRTLPDAQVSLDGEPLRVADDGSFIFGFGRDDKGTKVLRIHSASGDAERQLQLQSREWNIQYVEGVPKETVSPPAEVLARIRRESAQVAAARKTDSDRLDFASDFMWPVAGRISGVYGSQRFYNGVPKNPHYGVDIAAPTGTPVHAPAAGVVTLAHSDMFYSGGTLLIDHGLGLSSTFIHLHRILVKEGEEVKQGQVIAEVGASGRATGPHLDWRLNWYAERLDPQWFLGGSELTEVLPGQVPQH